MSSRAAFNNGRMNRSSPASVNGYEDKFWRGGRNRNTPPTGNRIQGHFSKYDMSLRRGRSCVGASVGEVVWNGKEWEPPSVPQNGVKIEAISQIPTKNNDSNMPKPPADRISAKRVDVVTTEAEAPLQPQMNGGGSTAAAPLPLVNSLDYARAAARTPTTNAAEHIFAQVLNGHPIVSKSNAMAADIKLHAVNQLLATMCRDIAAILTNFADQFEKRPDGGN